MTAALDPLASILTPEATELLRETWWLIGGFVAMVTYVLRAVSKARKALVELIDSRLDAAIEAAMFRQLEPIRQRQIAIEQTVQQLAPNGGESDSVSDRIQRIEQIVTRLQEQPPVVVNHIVRTNQEDPK